MYNLPDMPRLACEFWVSLEFYKIVIVLLDEIQRSSGLSEFLINHEEY